jgi:hypothetical protein
MTWDRAVRRRNADLLAAVLLATVSAFVVEHTSIVAVRLVFVLPLLLFLPGYATTVATFGRTRLDGAQVVLLSLALSLSTVSLGALVLYLLPWGLRSSAWSLLAASVVWAGCAIAALRRAGTREQRRSVVFGLRRLRARDVVLLVGAAMIAAAAIAVARTPLPAAHAQGYSSLWLLPRSSERASTLDVGVTSGELFRTRYRLVVRSGTRSVYSRRLGLGPGDSWQHTIRLTPSGNNVRRSWVTAFLYRSNDRVPYRRVRVRLTGGSRA